MLAQLGEWGLHRLGAVSAGGQEYTATDMVSPVALVLGNEGHDLPEGVDRTLDGRVTIPMEGRAESLNVGMAAAVLCFEAARQRRLAGREMARSG